jgi:hypothetical protein
VDSWDLLQHWIKRRDAIAATLEATPFGDMFARPRLERDLQHAERMIARCKIKLGDATRRE